MTRALFVLSWAENELNRGRRLPSGSLDDIAPRQVTRAARVAARGLAGSIERTNQKSLDEIGASGYDLAMKALRLIDAIPDIVVPAVSTVWDVG